MSELNYLCKSLNGKYFNASLDEVVDVLIKKGFYLTDESTLDYDYICIEPDGRLAGEHDYSYMLTHLKEVSAKEVFAVIEEWGSKTIDRKFYTNLFSGCYLADSELEHLLKGQEYSVAFNEKENNYTIAFKKSTSSNKLGESAKEHSYTSCDTKTDNGSQYKYFLAIDSFTTRLDDGLGVDNKAYCIINGEMLPLKDNDEVQVYNIENYVGDGESLEYDLYEVPRDLCVVHSSLEYSIKEDRAKVSLSYDSTDKSMDESSIIEIVIKYGAQKNFNLEAIDIEAQGDFTPKSSLFELKKTLTQQDFAYRHLDEDGQKFLVGWFKNKRKGGVA